MAMAGSHRSHLFKPGANYRVLKTWSFFGSTFTQGSVVNYESCAYERYDNQSLFRFYPAGVFVAESSLIWRLGDEEPESKAREYFEKQNET